MKKWWILGGAGAGLIAAALAGVYAATQARLTRIYEVPAAGLAVPAGPYSVERGRHIFRFRGCEACHSSGEALQISLTDPAWSAAHLDLPSQDVPRMEGNIYMDDPAVGRVVASNLTAGAGGVAGQYPADADLARAIRHGIRPDGTPLLFMPSTEFYFLSDEDLGAVIAYIRSAPPIDLVLPPSRLSFTGRLIMTLIPQITFIPAELIPHAAERPVPPPPAITAEYGEYLTYSCKVCHGPGMSGGPIPGFPSAWPPAPNLTFGPGSALPGWTLQGFIAALRTGTAPDGREIRSAYMPWTSYRYMEDEELNAVWVYLKSLPPTEYGNR